VPYLAVVAPYWFITDETCEKANVGWRRFIWLNFFAGFVITMLLIVATRFRLGAAKSSTAQRAGKRPGRCDTDSERGRRGTCQPELLR
jgi:hypothetical protein